MEYEIKPQPLRRIVGLRTRTSNHAPDIQQKIGALWVAFYGGEKDRIPSDEGNVYGVYTNYESDHHGEYDFVLGREVPLDAPLPEGMVETTLAAGRFACFSFHGDMQKDLYAFWSAVWDTPLERSYTADYEVYPPAENPADADMEIHIALL